MKALRTILTAIVLLTGSMTMNAQRMSIIAIQDNARFLTDRMAYTLGIRDPYLIDEIYRINYDYIWGVNDYLDDVALGYYYDDYMTVCAARDAALRNLLGYTIWNRLIAYSYFHRPIVFVNRGWHFSIYDYDRYGVHRFYYHPPRPIAHGYAGGHFFRPMAPRGGRMTPPPPAPRQAPAPHHERGNAPGGSYRGAIPRGNQPQPHSGNAPQPQMNQRGQMQPHSGNAPQPQMNQRGQMTPDGNASRSHSNMHSSSRGSNFTPARSQASPARGSNFTPARGNASPTRGSNGPSRGAGGIRGGRR